MLTSIKWMIDFVVGAALFIQAALFLPQILRLYRQREANALSIWMLVGLVVLAMCGALHGHIQHNHMELLGYALFFITGLVALAMTLYFRIKAKLSRKKGELTI